MSSGTPSMMKTRSLEVGLGPQTRAALRLGAERQRPALRTMHKPSSFPAGIFRATARVSKPEWSFGPSDVMKIIAMHATFFSTEPRPSGRGYCPHLPYDSGSFSTERIGCGTAARSPCLFGFRTPGRYFRGASSTATQPLPVERFFFSHFTTWPVVNCQASLGGRSSTIWK